MHAAYNVQALVIKGYIFAYYVSQSRTDVKDFIPILLNFKKNYDYYPKRVCDDAGYGSHENYNFMRDNLIENYVKH